MQLSNNWKKQIKVLNNDKLVLIKNGATNNKIRENIVLQIVQCSINSMNQ